MTVRIRAMRDDDARAYLEVLRAAIREVAVADYPAEVIEAWAPPPPSEGDVARVLANPDGEVRVIAEIDGRVVGLGSIVPHQGELRACYVSPRALRLGVGTAIVEEIERIAREHGVTVLELDSSLTAAPFYRSQGYVGDGQTVHRLSSGQPMASVKMRKDLDA